MSIASVVGRGYGSFGTVNFVPTFGYSIGAPLAVTDGRLEFTVPNRRNEFTVRTPRLEFSIPSKRNEFTVPIP